MKSDEVYLAQTDTTVGFLSSSYKKLNHIKNRSLEQKVLITTTTFKTLKNLTRVPKKHKKSIRRAKKTTFIYPNEKAIRVIKSNPHQDFLKRFEYLFSTSANPSGGRFILKYALEKADIVVYDTRGFDEKKPSTLIKLSKNFKKKVR